MSIFDTKPRFREINTWQDELRLGSKRAVIQRGDILFIGGENVTDITGVFGTAVTLVTNSPYYHMAIYDHAGRFVHAGWPKVESRDLRVFYLKKSNGILTWGRPRHADGRPVTEEEASKVIAFAEEQIGKPYDVLANLSFLLRVDGLPEIPPFVHKLFQERNWLEDHNRWHCSELVGASWFKAAGVIFVEDMDSKSYLSPADIYDSLYQDVVCTLKLRDGRFKLLTK
jgi:cell wall-associated NlpC family hydrolase